MDTASFMVLTKADDFYKDIVEDIEERHNPSNHNEERRKRSLPVRKNKKWLV